MNEIPFKKLVVLLLAAMLLFAAAAFAQEEESPKVTDIQISGNKKVETETIRTKLGMKVGDVFSPSRVRSDVSNLYKMGYFSDVQVEADGYAGGLRIIFKVVERPIIRSFDFEGNAKLESTKLREKVNLTPYSVYNPALVSENVEKLKLFYQSEGYFNAEVTPIIKQISDKEVKVIFRVNEGGKVYISKVVFVGNEKMSSRKIRKVMSTRKHIFLWSWVMKTGTYKLVEFSQDIERIKALYYNNGYIQVNVGEPQVVLSEDKRYLTITIPIQEGEQFRYRNIDIKGNTVFTKEELFKGIKSEPGEVMSRDQLKEDIVGMTDLYGSKGYAFASISPVVNPDVDARLVDVSFEVFEGDKVFVNRINISGNTKTRDKVIRREMAFNEGEIYDSSSLKTTYERLKNLDFFEDVEIVPNRKGEKSTVDLDVKVKEKSTGSFSIGGGYSTIDRLVAIGEVTQNNFLGLGQKLTFKGQFGARRQNYVLSWVEPWLLDRPISLSVDLFKEERVADGYTKHSVGGGFSLGRRFWTYYGVTGSYLYSRDRYTDVVQTLLDESHKKGSSLEGAFDDTTISKVGLNLYRDSRDNYIDPRRGSRNSLYGELSSKFLGAESSFYKAIADTLWCFPFYWDTAFTLHGRAGYIGILNNSSLPQDERFFVGGISTVRGVDWGKAGPRATDDRPIGGLSELIFNAEYTFPLVPSIKLRGVTFFDAGDAYGFGDGLSVKTGELKTSVGAGFRWQSPMGMIRLEYGHVLNRGPDEKTGKWEFSMGGMF